MKRFFLFLMACFWAGGMLGQHRSDALDDVLQHVPMASVFALKGLGEAGLVEADNATPWLELTATAIGSYALSAATTYSLKQLANERRPDKSDRQSFPSGHATFAFAGATMLCHEFGHVSPWVIVGGYGLATLTALDRLRLDRHYLHDVCAGAAVGIMGTEVAYFLKRKIIKDERLDLSFTGQTVSLAYRF